MSEPLIEKYMGDEWYIEAAIASPAFVTAPAMTVSTGLKPLTNQYSIGITFYYEGKVYWCTLIKDQRKISEEIIQKHIDDNAYYKNWFYKWEKITEEFNQLFNNLISMSFDNLENKQLLELKDDIYKKYYRCREISMFLDAFSFGSEKILYEELEAYSENNPIDIAEVYQALTMPDKGSFFQEYELDIINLAKNDLDENEPLIKQHLKEYCWIKSSWEKGHKYTFKILKEAIDDIKNLKMLEKEKIGFLDKIKKNNLSLLKKYEFTKRIKAISDLAGFFSYWQDLRKINAMKFVYINTLFFEELSKRVNISLDDLLLMDVNEMELIIDDIQKTKEIIKKRKDLFLILFGNGKSEFIYGETAKTYYDHIVEKDYASIDEIKGMVASKGIVTGRVRVVHGNDNFNPDEILVTTMTRPDFLPIMKKAKAIVTDDGGITCHAAIVSREMGIPCIIGTRIATKVLKDGDIVEVDANSGIVRKIDGH